MLKRKLLSVFMLSAFLLPTIAFGQMTKPAVYQAPPEVIDKIKEEGSKNSQVMQTLSYLSDVIGARLTGSPALKRANEWTRDTMAKWGMKNAHLEAWGPFGRGWTLKGFRAQVVAPHNISADCLSESVVAFDKWRSNRLMSFYFDAENRCRLR